MTISITSLPCGPALLFAEPPWREDTAGECGRHGDRWEERTLWTSTALNEYLDWPQVRQVCCVERKVTRKGATRKELAYAITSLSPAQAGPQELLCLWRSHTGCYVRDVTMKEDHQVRSGSAPQVMAALRNTTLGLLRQTGATNIAAALTATSLWRLWPSSEFLLQSTLAADTLTLLPSC